MHLSSDSVVAKDRGHTSHLGGSTRNQYLSDLSIHPPNMTSQHVTILTQGDDLSDCSILMDLDALLLNILCKLEAMILMRDWNTRVGVLAPIHEFEAIHTTIHTTIGACGCELFELA